MIDLCFECIDCVFDREKGIDYRVIHRYEFDKKLIDWADVIFTAGGDGTFLMVASNVKGHSKPIIGINTDPLRLEELILN